MAQEDHPIVPGLPPLLVHPPEFLQPESSGGQGRNIAATNPGRFTKHSNAPDFVKEQFTFIPLLQPLPWPSEPLRIGDRVPAPIIREVHKHTCAVIFGWSSLDKTTFPTFLDGKTCWLEGANQVWVAFDLRTGVVKLDVLAYAMTATEGVLTVDKQEPLLKCQGYEASKEPFQPFVENGLTPDDRDNGILWTRKGDHFRAWRPSTWKYDDTVIPDLVVNARSRRMTIQEFLKTHTRRAVPQVHKNLGPERHRGSALASEQGRGLVSVQSMPRAEAITNEAPFPPSGRITSLAVPQLKRTRPYGNEAQYGQRPYLNSYSTQSPSLHQPSQALEDLTLPEPHTPWQQHPSSSVYPGQPSSLGNTKVTELKMRGRAQMLTTSRTERYDLRSQSPRGQMNSDMTHRRQTQSSSYNQQAPAVNSFSHPL
ncbi:MAG: hypothetical protein Q9220_002248 [cf. Caloplaca sp. 1 TL-2023]